MNPKPYEMLKHFEIMENTSGIYNFYFILILYHFLRGVGVGVEQNSRSD